MRWSNVFTGVGLCGVVGTGILAGDAGAKLSKKGVNLLKIRSWAEFKDVIGDIWKPVAAGGLTIACILTGKEYDRRTITALAALGSASAGLYTKYIDKFKNFIGEEKFNEIKAEISKELSDKERIVKADNSLPPARKVKILDAGMKKAHRIEDERAIDLMNDDPKRFVVEINGRTIKFESTVAKVMWAIMELEHAFNQEALASSAEFLDLLGVSDEIESGDNILGWSYDSVTDFTDDGSWIDFEFYIWRDDDGEKVCTIACDSVPPVYLEDLDSIYTGIGG